MKRQIKFFILYTIFFNIFLCAVSNLIFGEDKTSISTDSGKSKKQETGSSKSLKENLMNNTFVLETNDESAAESLERISGKVDMGFSSPENTYKSEDHYAPGPFAKEKIEESKQRSSSY